MMIYINARFLTQPTTGVQRFAGEVSIQLQSLSANVCFISPRNILNHELARKLKVICFGRLSGHLWEQTELPLFLKKRNNPILVNLGNTGPIFYSNSIVTIHDLSIFMFPKAYSWKFYYLYKYLIPAITKNARIIITVSEGVKLKIVQDFNIPHNKVKVVHNAASHIRVDDSTPAIVNHKNYILSVASFNPIKNLPRLIEAFEGINDKNMLLIIVGARQKAFNDGKLNKYSANNRILFKGHVENTAELVMFYKNASAFIFPSLYESFGIPNLEAMTCGCPVITSNTGSLPEICGDAALYLNPYDADDIREKINTLLENPVLKQDLIQKGYNRVKHFSWESSAKKLLSIIQEIK
jgi:glycosyltransferase involved in cell wall biosynthesis